ncbi:MAG: WD40 repeat domain-containing protein [Phycisphaerae bacterium]|jgi:WD40 repeat protein
MIKWDVKLESMSPEKREYAINHLVSHVISSKRWDRLEELLLNIFFLEEKTEAGKIYELAEDFAEAIRSIPSKAKYNKFYSIIKEAIRRDIHFIEQHPGTLFQCLWNACWWYDCHETHEHYNVDAIEYSNKLLPWKGSKEKICKLLESWDSTRATNNQNHVWLKSHRPPIYPLNQSQIRVFNGHKSGIRDVCFSRNDEYVISVSADATARVWDVKNGIQACCLEEIKSMMLCVSVSPKGNLAAIGCIGGAIYLWDWSNSDLTLLGNHNDSVYSLAYSPGSDKLLSGSSDGTVRIWDISRKEKDKLVTKCETKIRGVCWAPNGEFVAVDSGGNIEVIDSCSLSKLSSFEKHSLSMSKVAVSHDSRYIASGDVSEVVVWDAKTRKEKCHLCGHKGHIYDIAFFNKENKIASCSHDGTICVWDISKEKAINHFKGHASEVYSISISSDDALLISGSEDKSIRVWDINKKSAWIKRSDHKDIVSGIVMSQDYQLVASWSEDFIKIWDSSTGLEKLQVRHKGKNKLSYLGGNIVNQVIFLNNGQCIASCATDGTILVWDIQNNKNICRMESHSGIVLEISSILSDKRLISRCNDDGTIRLWEIENGNEILSLGNIKNKADNFVISPGDKYVSVSFQDGSIAIVDPVKGTILRTLTNDSVELDKLSYSPMGKYLLCVSISHQVKIWNVQNDVVIFQCTPCNKDIATTLFSNDENMLLICYETGEIELYVLPSGSLFNTISTDISDLCDMFFMKCLSDILCIVDEQHCCHFWNIKTCRKVVDIIEKRNLLNLLVNENIPIFRPIHRANDTAIKNICTGEEIAWLPGGNWVEFLHHEKRMCIASVGGQLEIYSIENL